MAEHGFIRRNRTLGELLAELKSRLGFVAQGPGSAGNDPVLMSFLREAHDYVYGELKPSAMFNIGRIMLQKGSYLYDWHNDDTDEDIDPGMVSSLWIRKTLTERYELVQGVTQVDKMNQVRQMPRRYDTYNGQLIVWPIPDQIYELLIEHKVSQPRFTYEGDRPGVPDRLVFLYALANAKAHYNRPDAQLAGTTFNNMLAKEKTKQHENRRYLIDGDVDTTRTVEVNGTTHTFVVK
jgi:hypothetical protein